MSLSTIVRNKTEWRARGFVPQDGMRPAQVRVTRAPWGRCEHHLFLFDQVRPLRRRSAPHARSFPATLENVALATFLVNRSAKRYRDAASSCYEKGAFAFATQNKARTDSLYRAKDVGVRRLIDAGALRCVSQHGDKFLWQGLGYSFHSARMPDSVPVQTSPDAVFVPAKPAARCRMRLIDARELLGCLTSG